MIRNTSVLALVLAMTIGCTTLNPALGQSNAAPTSAGSVTPAAFLQKIYSNYGKNGPGFKVSGVQGLTVLDPTLYQLIQADSSVKGDVGKLDVDPICDCQDFEDLTAVNVTTKPSTEPQHILAVATFKNFGKVRNVGYDLVKDGNSWRIYDISSIDTPSLRRFLQKPAP